MSRKLFDMFRGTKRGPRKIQRERAVYGATGEDMLTLSSGELITSMFGLVLITISVVNGKIDDIRIEGISVFDEYSSATSETKAEAFLDLACAINGITRLLPGSIERTDSWGKVLGVIAEEQPSKCVDSQKGE